MASAEERYSGRRVTAGNDPTGEIRYLVREAAMHGEAVAAILAASPNLLDPWGSGILFIPRLNVTADELGEGYWDGAAYYGRLMQTGESEESFDTFGGSEHIASAWNGVYQRIPDPGADPAPPDHRDLIAVRGDTVQGVDRDVSAYNFILTHCLASWALTPAYRYTLYTLTNCVNSAPFKGYAPGECRFRGVQGGRRGQGDYQLAYHFTARPNVQRTFTFASGQTAQVTKAGWDYLWEDLFETVEAGTLVKRLQAVYTDQVYPYGDLNALGI